MNYLRSAQEQLRQHHTMGAMVHGASVRHAVPLHLFKREIGLYTHQLADGQHERAQALQVLTLTNSQPRCSPAR